MNIKQLEVFAAIAASGSFLKGAEAACITQSTVSQHIATLEDLCGVRLFDRTKRGAMPTEAGKRLLVHARKVLKALKETEQVMLQFRQADGIELAVGGSTIPGTYLLPKAIAALRASDPGITVQLDIGNSDKVLERLGAEETEIAVVGAPADPARFTSTALGHDEVLLVARKGHPWCKRSSITPDDLLLEPIILRCKGSGTHDVVATALRQQGIRSEDLKVSATISSSEAMKQAILAGCGVAFISEMAIRQELKQGKLVAVQLPGLTITRGFSLVRRRGRTLSPAAELFSRALAQLQP